MTTTTTTRFALKIGYVHYIMAPADAAKVMELLGKSRCITTEYLGGETHYRETSRDEIAIELFNHTITDPVRCAELRDADAAAWQAEKAARAAKAAEASEG